MSRWARPFALAVAAALPLAAVVSPAASAAEPVHRALVVGNGAYQQFAQPEQCQTSAKYLADALGELAFRVDQIVDGTNGKVSAGIFRLAQPAAPDALVLAYFCGYGVMFEGRAFLVPIKADLEAPFRVLTEGILAKSIYAAIERSGASQGLVVLDIVVPDTQPEQAAFVAPPPPANIVTLVSTGVTPSFPGRIGLRLAKDVRKPGAELGAILTAIFEEPAVDTGRDIDLSGLPAAPIALRPGISEAAPVAAPAEAATTPEPAAAAAAAPAPASETAAEAEPAQAAASPSETPPAEETGFALSLSEEDRRRIQAELTRLGFYNGGIDGDFGPGTRSAVARFQQDAGEAATGRLTPAQAMRLLAGAGE